MSLHSSDSTQLMLSLFEKSNSHTSSVSSSVITPLTPAQIPLDLSDINLKLLQEHQIHNKLQSKINELRINTYNSSNNTNHLDYNLQFNFKKNEKIVFIMVGLPASGKSTISKQLNEYFNKFTQLTSKIYNAGNVRRKCQLKNDANFFDPNDENATLLRENYVNITIGNLITDLNNDVINIGFLDATNSTIDRRKRMIDKIIDEIPNPTIILMNVVNNNIHQNNFNIACKTKNPDYSMKNYYDSINDFKIRTQHYLKIYEPITAKELINYPINLYINFENGGEIFDVNRFDNMNLNFLSLLDHFVRNYPENFGNEYLKRVHDWIEFIEGLGMNENCNDLDSDFLKSNLKAELQG